MVYRVFVEKKSGLAQDADALLNDLRALLHIEALSSLRIINRYDVENISPELFASCVKTVFSEPQLDDACICDDFPETSGKVFAVEYLPGQFDQRADSAAQCIQIISQGERPTVRTAKLYILGGELSDPDVEKIKKYVINPVESREAALAKPDTLAMAVDVPQSVAVLDGFISADEAGLENVLTSYGLAMDMDDLRFLQSRFIEDGRDPTVTELKLLDTYWSDHCRHTTFLTTVDSVHFEDLLLQEAWERYKSVRRELGRDNRPVNLMDLGTIAAKYLKKTGQLTKLDESEEINACTVKIQVEVDGETQDWLLLFKNETHNHPTEIEPFGGAATCIGGAIRDPLSGRAYVYAAMRVTGAADPTVPVSETLAGKLPQRKLTTTAAAGYSSYGNQIGLATGIVDELYHPGYAAKRMEIGAVIGAVPAENVRREEPTPGDVIILLGGKTGRDGCGGATGSSKSHTLESLETCGAEVQKGNAPEERKLQRLFRNPEASRLIKRCNDFGAGGVSVAVGELADGLDIDLNAVPKKYEGLDGTELAIAESQERMAVCVEAKDAPRFMEIAFSENLEATEIAVVTEEPRLVMRWNGVKIVDISREFLDSNGAEKHITVETAEPQSWQKQVSGGFAENYISVVTDLNSCSRRGLVERFDSTIGAGSVLMPFGGKRQLTPIQAMVNKISLEKGHTDDCSFMAWGYDPYVAEKSPYHGAYLAVAESVCKLIAAGASFDDVYLSFQEYFEKPGHDPKRWGKPLSALLGALDAQLGLGIAAIGGKDSMSGSFEKLDVPPTLVSFAVTTGKTGDVITPEFKAAGHKVVWLRPEYDKNGLPDAASLKALFARVTSLMRSGAVAAAWTPGHDGAAGGIFKMCLGNGLGFELDGSVSLQELFGYAYGSFILELNGEPEADMAIIGTVMSGRKLSYSGVELDMDDMEKRYNDRLEGVYRTETASAQRNIPTFSYTGKALPAVAKNRVAVPKALIPVFPGTNCEYDTARALRDAGIEPEIFVVNNLSAASIADSVTRFAGLVDEAQIIFIPGGFSGGDEPDGSGKFITAFFRNGAVADSVTRLLDVRGGLMCGICNGFQALIKLGLVPYGKITEANEKAPTLTFNSIGRHQSRLVRTRVASDVSPWLAECAVGDIYTVPISHGEGRFYADEETIKALAASGQIATQYVDELGAPTANILYNPNDSAYAIEGITSPDGRVLGKMGHSERVGAGLYQNVPGSYDMGLFRSAAKYFR